MYLYYILYLAIFYLCFTD